MRFSRLLQKIILKGCELMKYFVVSKFYNSGKVEACILLESEITDDVRTEEKEDYDQYVDEFPSYEEADEFKKQCALA
jgi:hypothetical protein